MNGLTHVNYMGDRRHTQPMTEGILYITKMSSSESPEQQQPRHKKVSRKTRRSSDDSSSVFSQSSTISLIKSRFHRFRNGGGA